MTPLLVLGCYLLMFRSGALLRRAHVPVPAEVIASSKYALSAIPA